MLSGCTHLDFLSSSNHAGRPPQPEAGEKRIPEMRSPPEVPGQAQAATRPAGGVVEAITPPTDSGEEPIIFSPACSQNLGRHPQCSERLPGLATGYRIRSDPMNFRVVAEMVREPIRYR